MAMCIETIIKDVRLTKSSYIYKPMKKLAKYGIVKYDLMNNGIEEEFVIVDEELDVTYYAKEDVTVICEYKKLDQSIFTLEVTINDNILFTRELPNLCDIDDGERFQISLIYRDKYFTFDELLEIQMQLVQHYHLRNVAKSYKLKENNYD